MSRRSDLHVFMGETVSVLLRLTHRCLAVALVASGALALTPASSVQAEPAVVLTPGNLLPLLRDRVDQGSGVIEASASYVVHDRLQLDVSRGPMRALVRLSDGAEVLTLPEATSSRRQEQLVDDALVQVEGDDASSFVMTVRDAATGATRAQRRVERQDMLHLDDEWALGATRSEPEGRATLRFWRVDDTVVDTDRDFGASTLRWVGGDSATAFVSDSTGSWVVDTSTGRTRQVFDDTTSILQVTDDHLLASRRTPNGHDRVVLRDRDSGLEEVSPPLERTWQTELYLALGDGVAAVHRTSDGMSRELRPLDLSTGGLGEPVLRDVGRVRHLDDGRVVATVLDEPGGRVVVGPEPDGSFRRVAALPRLDDAATRVALSGGRLFASWQEHYQGVWTREVSSGGTWQGTYPDAGGGSQTDGFVVGGDVVVGETSRNAYRVSWPGGSRDVSARSLTVTRDGEFLVREPISGGTELQEARTGSVVRTWTTRGVSPLLDGRLLWDRRVEGDGRLTAVDIYGEQPDELVDVGARCADGWPWDAWGRWLVVRCGDQDLVIDRSGRDPARPVSGAHLGNGFLAVLEPIGERGHGGTQLSRVRVIDLATGRERLYGPAYSDVSVDRSGLAALAYVDQRLQARHVTLDWLTPVDATTDLQGPVPTTSPQLPTHGTAATDLELRWSFTDPTASWSAATGVASHDVRVRSLPAGEWRSPPAWQDTARAAVTVRVEAGEGACHQARARDQAGNVGVWSAEVCHTVDDRPPVLTRDSQLPPRMAADRVVMVPLEWAFSDGDGATETFSGLASYDVRTRPASVTAWEEPASWQQLETPRVNAAMGPGGRRCWSARARDRVGNRGEWSPAVCTYIDGAAPVAGAPSGTGPALATSPARMTFRSVATDDDQVASYDIQTREARAGRARGPWTTAASGVATGAYTSGWLSAGSELCVRARARDRLGQLSTWSGERCSTAPVDSASMARAGRTARVATSTAVGGDYTRLLRKGASVTTPSLTGRSVAVWVMRGPRLGATDVYVGTRRIGRVQHAAAKAARAMITVPVTGGFTGRVRLVSVSAKPAQVDAVTVLR